MELVSFENGLGIVRVEGRYLRFALAGDQLWLEGRVHPVPRPQGPRRAGAAASASGERRVKAQMPGTILAVRVEPGDLVETGDILIMMESMKMEMAVAAPRAGRVAAVACRAGQMVEMGAVLVELEDAAEAG